MDSLAVWPSTHHSHLAIREKRVNPVEHLTFDAVGRELADQSSVGDGIKCS